jgi:hypothetical protein
MFFGKKLGGVEGWGVDCCDCEKAIIMMESQNGVN